MKANFILTSEHLAVLQNKAKLNSFFNNTLTKTFFKVSNTQFILFQRGTSGAFSITLDITNSNLKDNEKLYYSVDYSKWNNALAKFSNFSEINITVKKNMLTLSTSGTSDVINLGIISYDIDSSEAILIDSFIDNRKNDLIDEDTTLVLTEELLENFQLADSLFSAQGKNNSIGLSENEVIYSDRSVVLKIHLLDTLPNSLFKNLRGEDYIFIHTFFLKMFSLLSKTSDTVQFSRDYETIYWEDDNSKLLISSESREVALPTQDQWEAIKPVDENSSFTISLASLSEGLNFFTGFYEETAWKPLTFDINKNSVVLYYRHPTTEISKALGDVDLLSTTEESFMISSEILGKIINKVGNRFSLEEQVFINYDDEAPGIYCRVNNTYEFILSKLIDVMQD